MLSARALTGAVLALAAAGALVALIARGCSRPPPVVAPAQATDDAASPLERRAALPATRQPVASAGAPPAAGSAGEAAPSPIGAFLTELLPACPSHDQLLHRRLDDVDLEKFATAVQAHGLDADLIAMALDMRSESTERCLLLLALAFARGFAPRHAELLHAALDGTPHLLDAHRFEREHGMPALAAAHALRLRGRLGETTFQRRFLDRLTTAPDPAQVWFPQAARAILDMLLFEVGGQRPIQADVRAVAKRILEGSTFQSDRLLGAQRVAISGREAEAIAALAAVGPNQSVPILELALVADPRQTPALRAFVAQMNERRAWHNVGRALGGLLAIGTRRSVDAVLDAHDPSPPLRIREADPADPPKEMLAPGLVLVPSLLAIRPQVEPPLRETLAQMTERAVAELRGLHLSPHERRRIFAAIDRVTGELGFGRPSIAVTLRLMGELGSRSDMPRIEQLGRTFAALEDAAAAVARVTQRRRLGGG